MTVTYNQEEIYINDFDDPDPVLPDASTVPGRYHYLFNHYGSDVTWHAGGATPFVIDGLPATALIQHPEDMRIIYSNGVSWIHNSANIEPRKEATRVGVTGADGTVTFTFDPPFPLKPIVTLAVQTTDGQPVDVRVTALDATHAVVSVRHQPALTVLGISVMGPPQPVSGASVNLYAQYLQF